MDRTVIQMTTSTLLDDPFGWVQGWRFAIADYLTEQGEHVPGFRQGPFGPDRSFEYEELEAENPSLEALWYADRVLGRYREWLRIAGMDY